MRKVNNYFRVVAAERDDSADLYLYGFIGQRIWYDEDAKDETLTDLEVVRKIKELERKYDRINVRINSPGGSVFHGDPIVTALRGSTAEIHTYIDGIAASMAADIWIAGNVRHMASNSKLMIHSTSSLCWGTAKDMIEMAEMLEKFDSAAISTFSEVTGMDAEEVKSRFYDYRDHWVLATEAKDMGLIDSIESYSVPEDVDGAERLAYPDLLKMDFSLKEEEENEPETVDDIELETELFLLENE